MIQKTLTGEEYGKVKGIITDVIVRNGKTNNKEWTLHIVKLGEESYSAFAGSIPRLDALKEGDEVEIIYTTNGNYKNIAQLIFSGDQELYDVLSPEIKAKIQVVAEMMERTGNNASKWTNEQTNEVIKQCSNL